MSELKIDKLGWYELQEIDTPYTKILSECVYISTRANQCCMKIGDILIIFNLQGFGEDEFANYKTLRFIQDIQCEIDKFTLKLEMK